MVVRFIRGHVCSLGHALCRRVHSGSLGFAHSRLGGRRVHSGSGGSLFTRSHAGTPISVM